MSKHRREGDLSGRDVGLIGEHHERVAGYESPMWEAVNKMVEGHMPTTNLCTMAAGSHHGAHSGHHRSIEREQRHMVEGERHHKAKHGGHMKHHEEHPRHKKHHEEHEGHKKHHMAHEGHAKHHRKHFAAGGVGKVRKGEY